MDSISDLHDISIRKAQLKGTIEIFQPYRKLSHQQITQILDTFLAFFPKNSYVDHYVIEAQPNQTSILLHNLSNDDIENILKHKKQLEKRLTEWEETKEAAHHSPSLEQTQESVWYQVKKLLAKVSDTFSTLSFSEIIEEALRIFLATDGEFKKIRPYTFLSRLICSQYSLRKTWSSLSHEPISTLIKTRVWKSILIFPFGRQKVLSLAISLSHLSPRERFELHHILSATRRIIPTVQAVPQSFYFYKHPRDHSWNLYVELENGTNGFSESDIKKLRAQLDQELVSSIEQVANRIDIPYNEEEILRTIHALSLELKTKNSIPQVLIQFQRQQLSHIQFNVYVLRVVRQDEIPEVGFNKKPTPIGMVQLKLQRQEVVGHIRKNHVKLLQLYEAQCDKKNVMRPDYSINFIKAREQVLYAIRLHFGPIRDVNGGFLAQQREFFSSIKQALPVRLDDREEQFLEQLVRSIKPSSGKLFPEKNHLLQLASLLFTLQREHAEDILSKESDESVYVVIRRPSNMAEDELLQVFALFSLPEHEILYSLVTHEESTYICFGILAKSPELRKRIVQWICSVVSDCALRLKRQQGIRISLPRPTRMLDPRIGTDRTSGAVIKMLYEGLMRLDPSGKPELAIAESYTVSPDEKRYTFTLRSSYWSNGEPLVASDFEYAWKKILDPSLKTLFCHMFLPIKNAHAVKDGTKSLDALGVKALDDRTLFVELEHPYPYFLELLTHWMYSPLCQTIDQVHPGWACFGAEQHVSNGPFRLIKWKQDKEIEAIKNEWYWNKHTVSLERIHMKIIEDPKLAWKLFMKGDLDWIGEPLSQLPSFVTKSPPPAVSYHQTNGVQWFVLNTTSMLFSNKKIRQAFSLSVNRRRIVDSCRFGKERLSHSLLPEQLSEQKESEPLPYDPEKALQLFEEGLLELGITRSDISLKMLSYDAEFLVLISQHAIYDWKKLFQIEISLEIVEWHRFFETLPSAQYDMVSIAWYSWFNHALYTLEALSRKESNMNICKWENNTFRELVKKIVHAPSEEARKEKIRKAEELLMDEMPVIPVFEYFSQYAKNRAVENIFMSSLGHIDFRWANILGS